MRPGSSGSPSAARVTRSRRRPPACSAATSPGADLLADVTVRPARRGGFLVVAATADAPDVAAAAADGFAQALVRVEGDPLALGAAATIPGEPFEDRPAGLWAGIGFLVGLLAGLLVIAVRRLARRPAGSRPAPPAIAGEPGPGAVESDPTAAFAARVGAGLAELAADPGGAIVCDGAGSVAISRPAVADVGILADRLGIRAGTGPGSLVVTAVGTGDAEGLGAALALAGAGAGRRVLLVAADLAGSSLAARLDVAAAPGLGEYLEGRASPREVLRTVGTGAASGSFACLPAGAGTIAAGVTGRRFAVLVDRLARVYDLVVYVAPPILGSEETDTLVELVDEAVVLVDPDPDPAELDQAAGLLEGIAVRAVAVASG